jgi:hypothetical protein
MSPVWDTAWAVRALAIAGLDKSHPAMERAVAWLLREQIPDDAPGDWRMKCKETRGNGWAFEFDNDAYPDIDDTTIVVLALLEGGDRNAVADSVERARRWTLAMDSRNGAWAAFDRDNTRELLYRMPFSDFGAMIDPPTEDVTAHVLEMLAALGEGASNAVVARGLEYLRATQKPWGSWYGRWGVNHVYGTWCVISALTALNRKRDGRARGRVAALSPKSRRRLGRELPFVCRRVVCRHREEHAVANRLGRAGASTCRAPATSGGRSGSCLSVRAAAQRRNVGRGGVHGNRLPTRLLHQLPPLSPPLPADGPRHEL